MTEWMWGVGMALSGSHIVRYAMMINDEFLVEVVVNRFDNSRQKRAVLQLLHNFVRS